MSERFKNSAGVAALARIRTAKLFLVDDRRKKIGRDEHQCSLEPGGRYSNDRERMLVELNSSAHHASIVLEAAVPVCIVQHDIRGAVGAVLFRGVKESP